MSAISSGYKVNCCEATRESTLRYKQTEVGVIPEDWDVKEIGDVATIATGNTPPTQDATNYGDEFLFVGPSDLGDKKHVFDTQKKLSKKGFSLSRVFPKESILFACIGTIGKCGVASVALTSNQQINAIFPSPDFSSDYLYYTMCAASSRIKALAGQQVVPIVNKKQFSETTVSFPPLPEQRAIATALSDVDALLAAQDKLIAKKRDIKQAAMQQLLTGKQRLPGFSGKWEMKPFGEVLSRVNAKEYQIQTTDYQETGDYPVVDQGKELVVGYSDRKDKCFQCPEGGVIVFGDHTCIIKFIDFNFVVGADGTQILSVKNGHNARFHSFQLQYDGISSTGYNRHFKFLKERIFPSPNLFEQEAIAAVLSDMDADLAALEQQRDKTRALKQGMMQELLTGRIRLI